MNASEIEHQIAVLQEALRKKKNDIYGPRKERGIFQIGSKKNPEKSFESWIGKLHKALNAGSERVLIATYHERWNEETNEFDEIEIKFTPEMFNDRENRNIFSEFVLNADNFCRLSSLRVVVIDKNGSIKESGTYTTKSLKNIYKKIDKAEANGKEAQLKLMNYIKDWNVDK